MTSYYRQFEINAAHFNGLQGYHFLWREDQKGYTFEGTDLTHLGTSDWKYLLSQGVHGHNFRIEVWAEGELDDQNFVINDEALEALIKEWDNRNLSLLDEFFKLQVRATTELMAEVLVEKIRRHWTNLCRVQVRVWETSCIYAESEWKDLYP